MSAVPSKRTRVERVQALPLPPGRFQQLSEQFRHAALWGRFALAGLAAVIMLVVCQCWEPPFSYRTGYVPPRDMIARVNFQVPDETKTRILQDQRRRETIVYYRNRSQSLNQLREALRDQLFLVLSAPSLEQLSSEGQDAWGDFFIGDETAGPDDSALARFAALKATFADDPELKRLDEAVKLALLPHIEHGLLLSLSHSIDAGNQAVINVYDAGHPDLAIPVEIDKVRIATASIELVDRLKREVIQRFEREEAPVAAEMIAEWLAERLPVTLTYDPELSAAARDAAAESVEPVMVPFTAGVTSLAPAGRPLRAEKLELLRYEWNQLRERQTWTDRMLRVGAYFGMITALYMLVGGYIYFVDDRRMILDHLQLARLLGLATITIALCQFASREQWQSEVVPLTMAAIVAAIAYGRELALVLLSALCLATTLFVSQDVNDLVSLSAASLSCILFLGRIRSRSRLLYVGIGAAIVTAATVIGIGIVTDQTMMDQPTGVAPEGFFHALPFSTAVSGLVSEAVWTAGFVVVASLAMTGLLPLVEKLFGVQTDLSLLELGDASHPLLRQLAQRAPGTYNHSINVASIAEAAAERIGANGLLVRVGAYFHDIGKMFKPDYFIENQGQGPNQHDSLQPAMSTLVIIAHVKDGADLARSHHLPAPIIDFILQHHGTTLVEYFYHQAARKSEQNPNGEEVSDKDFRYPGPRPQTLEAAVLMLADTVESAARALVDPTPSRIASLVDSIAMKKLTDRQFDECGLTLLQLDVIKHSLVKSLTAIYHARVKYPGQQSA
ncbi:HD family phosphohydrolase [Candidatus Laterigemmans baculatus]|uniref:HD family phosphohydrolase n=1 Tax=Candidatus Laterigemmans baculatus TaxID=2770505 RepID=UPI0013DAB386|nr:HDIG domain-containing metalloprotein [Candidatus Laterigemmans baculatus]